MYYIYRMLFCYQIRTEAYVFSGGPRSAVQAGAARGHGKAGGRVYGLPAEPICRTPSLRPRGGLGRLPPFVPRVDWVDGFWAAMAQLKTGVGCLRFDYLCSVMLPLLCLPNSNADSERVFSMVKKIQTDCRSDLGQDTICGLPSCKLNNDTDCYNFRPSVELLKAAKSATWYYVQAHQ